MEHNNSIHCTVRECKNHCKSEDYCNLQEISVVKHGAMANSVESTDCASFEKE
ncbi:DUF1540 domain-containing protein [Clostridium sp. DL1XJH146]